MVNNFVNIDSKLFGSANIIGIGEEKSLMAVTCSYRGCGEKGMAYVNTKHPSDKHHYCVSHNPMIVKVK